MAHKPSGVLSPLVALFLLLLLAGCADVVQEQAPRGRFQASAAPLPAQRLSWQSLDELPWPQGGQRTQQTFEESKRIFWKTLYRDGGTDLYCGVSFDAGRNTPMAESLSVEHVYPADVIAETDPGCTNRSCTSGRVQRAMADLQNLWPALQRVNSSRSKLKFGVLPTSIKPRFPEFCPAYRRGIGAQAVVEPRDAVKGDVARSIVYMHYVYGLPLEDAVNDRDLLLTWMAQDPPDQEETRRNELIARIQGTANPLLDKAFAGM